MDIETELKAIRYLINDLILYVYDLRQKVETISPTKREYKISEPNAKGDSISFDLFSISKERYNDLISRYGVDVINQAVVRLDEFIKINEYVPYKTPYNAINRKFAKDIIIERNANGNE